MIIVSELFLILFSLNLITVYSSLLLRVKCLQSIMFLAFISFQWHANVRISLVNSFSLLCMLSRPLNLPLNIGRQVLVVWMRPICEIKFQTLCTLSCNSHCRICYSAQFSIFSLSFPFRSDLWNANLNERNPFLWRYFLLFIFLSIVVFLSPIKPSLYYFE